MMNVLLLSDGPIERSGICSFMLQFVQGISTAFSACSISVYFRKSVKHDDVKKRFEDLGARVYLGDQPEDSTTTNRKYRKLLQNDFYNIIDKEQIDIIHINSSVKGFTCVALQVAKRRKIPVRIAHVHGQNPTKVYSRILTKYICHAATAYAGCSTSAGIYMYGESGVESPKWHFVPNTIDAQKYAYNDDNRMACRMALKLPENDLLIGAVGHLEEIKNHTFLLDVIASLKQMGKKATLIIFGEGSLRSVLEKKAEEMGIADQVILFGNTDQVYKWLSALDCYVMPSLSEGLPIAAVEAQANGLYCLLSDQVPQDVDLTKDVYHLAIDKGPEPWVKQILQLPKKSKEERLLGVENVCKAGFGKEAMPSYVHDLYQ